jgi:Ala-tRNA(Pro) deacylase
MGLMNDKDMQVRFVIDEDVLKSEYIGFHPCINTTTVRVTVEELRKIIIPKMGHTPTVVNLPREAN